jgi:hypothetical protein
MADTDGKSLLVPLLDSPLPERFVNGMGAAADDDAHILNDSVR